MAEDTIGVLVDADRREEETIEALDEELAAPPGRAGTFLIPETVP